METTYAIEILKLIRDNADIFGNVKLDEVFLLNNKSVEDIIRTKEDNKKVQKIKMYLDDTMKEKKILDILADIPEKFYDEEDLRLLHKHIEPFPLNKDIMHNDEMFEKCLSSMRRVSADADEIFNLIFGWKVASNLSVLRRNNSDEIISLIVNAKGQYQAEYGADVAMDERVLATANPLEIIGLITNAKGDSQAKYGYYTAHDKNVLATANPLEIISLVVNSEDEQQAQTRANRACMKNMISREDYYDNIKNVAPTRVASALSDNTIEEQRLSLNEILESYDIAEIIKILSNTNDYNIDIHSDKKLTIRK